MGDPSDPKYTTSNLGLLFFVSAVVYLFLMLVLMYRTSIPLFAVKKYPNTHNMRVFRAFYGFLWIATILSMIMYWVLFNHQAVSDRKPDDNTSGFTSVVLIFCPFILQGISYSLLYMQLEAISQRARM